MESFLLNLNLLLGTGERRPWRKPSYGRKSLTDSITMQVSRPICFYEWRAGDKKGSWSYDHTTEIPVG